MLAARLRPVIEPFTSSIGRSLARAGVSPNVLTTLGLLGTIAGAFVAATARILPGMGDNATWRIELAGYILIAPMVVDVLDGATARAMGRTTVWGGYFDSVADRVGDGALLAGLAYAARGYPRLLVAALTALVMTFCVPYARSKAEALGLTTVPGPGERAERAVILIAGMILFSFARAILEAALWITAALTLWTFVTRSYTVWRQTSKP